MASLGMNGPYDLTTAEVDRVVTKTSAGNYALGYVNDKKTFIVHLIKIHVDEGVVFFKGLRFDLHYLFKILRPEVSNSHVFGITYYYSVILHF